MFSVFNTITSEGTEMSNVQNNNDDALEWLNLKKKKGQTTDYVIKSEMEDIGNRFLRKFKENPFVPIGKLLNKINDFKVIIIQKVLSGFIIKRHFTVKILI